MLYRPYECYWISRESAIFPSNSNNIDRAVQHSYCKNKQLVFLHDFSELDTCNILPAFRFTHMVMYHLVSRTMLHSHLLCWTSVNSQQQQSSHGGDTQNFTIARYVLIVFTYTTVLYFDALHVSQLCIVWLNLKTECTGKPTEIENPSAQNNFFPLWKCCPEASLWSCSKWIYKKSHLRVWMLKFWQKLQTEGVHKSYTELVNVTYGYPRHQYY